MNSLKNEHQYKQAGGEIIHIEKTMLCTYNKCIWFMSQRNIALQRMESQRLYSIIDINFIF